MSSNDSGSNEDFDKNEGGSLYVPVKAGNLKKGDHVLAKDQFPCKVIEMTTSKTGKHGHAKAHITCIDIFTTKKYEINEPTSHNLKQPNVEKSEYDLVDLTSEGAVTFVDEKGEYDESLKMDTSDDLFKQIKSDLDGGANILISVTRSMNIAQVTSYRKE